MDTTLEVRFKAIADNLSLTLEAIAAAVITAAAFAALYNLIRLNFLRAHTTAEKKVIWRRFGTSLLLGLEFELAADIVRTAISPTWNDIGQLGAIAAIRTFLNFFLELDLSKAEKRGVASPTERRLEAAD